MNVYGTVVFVGFVLMYAHGHGVITQLENNGQTACAVHTGGCTSTNSLNLREVIPRSGNDGECALPPGCEADFYCDHCCLEKVETGSALDSSKWWTSMPAVNWDEDISKPIYPCMSYDDFGARGTMTVRAGDVLSVRIYINADHSGLYQYQLACGSEASNAAFEANPITPWKALHENKEGVQLDPDTREVGSTRAETDAYFLATDCTGAACEYRINRNVESATSDYCINNPDDCFVEDEITIPDDIACTDDAILRWMWNSAEGPEVYANCMDLDFEGDGASGVDTTDDSSTVVPVNPTNTATCYVGESCLATPTCCPVGYACFEKDDYWASCKTECTPGIDENDPPEYQTDWTCEILGGDVNAAATNTDGSQQEATDLMSTAFAYAPGISSLIFFTLAAFMFDYF